MNCPKCGSDQWRLASVIHAEGTTKLESLSFGSGAILAGGDVSPVLGSGISFGTQQTDLAKLVAPPEPQAFKPPRLRTPISNSYLKKGLLTGALGFLSAILGDHIDSIFFSLLVAILLLTSMWYVLKSAYCMFFGDEAKTNREILREEKDKWRIAEENKISEYKATRFCLRCGERYIPG